MEVNKSYGIHYEFHVQGSATEHQHVLPLAKILRSYVQQKFSLFTWEASWGRILTLDKLQRRGVPLVNKSFICHQYEVLVDHLRLHSNKMRVLRELLFSLSGATGIMSALVREMFLGWKVLLLSREIKKVQQVAPSCLFGIVLKAMNKICLQTKIFVYTKNQIFVSFFTLARD